MNHLFTTILQHLREKMEEVEKKWTDLWERKRPKWKLALYFSIKPGARAGRWC